MPSYRFSIPARFPFYGEETNSYRSEQPVVTHETVEVQHVPSLLLQQREEARDGRRRSTASTASIVGDAIILPLQLYRMELHATIGIESHGTELDPIDREASIQSDVLVILHESDDEHPGSGNRNCTPEHHITPLTLRFLNKSDSSRTIHHCQTCSGSATLSRCLFLTLIPYQTRKP